MEKPIPLTIIATQGYPYTGKTTIANALATRLKFPIVRIDDILDFIVPPGEAHPTPEKAETLKSHAFDLLTQTVETQISLGISAIVDSPLSHRSHLDRLVALVTASHATKARLLIVECSPKTRYTWEIRFNERDPSYNSKWYKPRTPRRDRNYTDEDVAADYPMVSKLVVNTTDYVSHDHVFEAVRDLIVSAEARPTVVDLEMWRRENSFGLHHDVATKVKIGKINKAFCKDAHCVNQFNEDGIDYYATCEVCEKVIAESVDSAYTCSLCPLAIHKPCAEAPGNQKVKALTPKNFPKFLETEPRPVYCFPEEHLCLRCIVEGNEFSYECEGCIFQCHLKCGLLPTIIIHEGHGGKLFFSVKSVSTLAETRYMCAACKLLGNYASYESIEDCNVNYHPECVMLPFWIEHEHGGYTDGLDLIFRRDEELDDYICHLCFQEMSPEAWYYNCPTCHLDLHINCAFKEFI